MIGGKKMSEKNKGIMDKIQSIIRPVGEFMSNEKHFASISAGLMSTLGVMIIGAFTQIITAIIGMFAEGGILAELLGVSFSWVPAVVKILEVPYNMTSGLISIIVAFGVAFQLAKHYKMNQMQAGITAMIMFLMVVSPATQVTLVDGVTTFSGLDTTFLGAPGMFTAIVISLLSVEISYFCIKRHWVIKMPEVVPTFLQDSFSAMIPILLNAIIIYGINVLLGLINPALNIATAITAIFMVPVSFFVGSVPGMIIINTFAVLLWTTGVHGTMITIPFILPVLIAAITNNGALHAAGLPTVFNPAFLFMATSFVGGTGCTLGLVLLCTFRAKSEQLKAVGKVSLLPGFFNVNEPMAFGVPIVYNPIMAIPYILTPIILTIISWIGYEIGFLVPGHIMFLSLMPLGVAEFIGTLNLKNFIFPWLMIPVTALIYYPFFRVYDKQLCEQEKEAALKTESETVA